MLIELLILIIVLFIVVLFNNLLFFLIIKFIIYGNFVDFIVFVILIVFGKVGIILVYKKFILVFLNNLVCYKWNLKVFFLLRWLFLE